MITAEAMSWLLTLPTEVLLHILSHLPVLSILSVCSACKVLHGLSHDSGIWKSVLRRLEIDSNIPVPTLKGVSGAEAENIAKEVYRTAQFWPRRRKPQHTKQLMVMNPQSETGVAELRGPALLSVLMLLDRYLLVVYKRGMVLLYDLETSPKTFPKSTYFIHTDDNITSCRACVDPTSNSRFILCLSHQHRTWVVYLTEEIPRRSSHYTHPLTVHAEYYHTVDHRLLHIDAHNHLIFFLLSSWGIVVQSYLEPSRNHAERIVGSLRNAPASVSPDFEEEEEYNGVLALTSTSDYVIAFRLRFLSLYSMNASSSPIGKHTFSPLVFRAAYFSQPFTDHDDSGITHVRALASDTQDWMFLFHITINPATSSFNHSILKVSLESVMTDTTPSPQPVIITGLCLGAQGKRAVWVERMRTLTGMTRSVKVWPDAGPDRESDKVVGSENGVTVYQQHSNDPRDEFYCVALGENQGRIALGNNNGEGWVIDVGI